MTDTPHLDDETLSSIVDGEDDPAALEHAAGCASCAGRLAAMRAVAAAVGRGPAPASPDQREAAIAAALAAAEAVTPSPWADELARHRSRRERRDRRFPAWLAAAAVVAALLAAIPLLSHGSTSKKTSASSGPATTGLAPRPPGSAADTRNGSAEQGSSAAAPSAAPKAASPAAAPVVNGGDLGALSDPRQMAVLAAIDFELRRPPGPIGSSAPLFASAPPADETSGCGTASGAAPAGSFPVYRATVRWNGAPAVVTGFLTPPGPLTFVVVSDTDCRVLTVAQA